MVRWVLLSVPLVLSGVLGACEGGGADEGSLCRGGSPGALFEQRVAPLLLSENPSSCSACHASGVELADFVRGTECEAMACLRAEGLVDLKDPEQSVLLHWIGRVPPESELIDERVVRAERAAFLEWFRYESECQTCADVECPDAAPSGCAARDNVELAFTERTDPGDCTDETLEQLFRGTVFLWRERCSPCHFEGTSGARDAPRYFATHGSCNVASLVTLKRMVAAGYIDVDAPRESLLLLKPLAEKDGGVPHGGHDKIVASKDKAYDAFTYFLDRYAACR